jgi:hypothetical protein
MSGAKFRMSLDDLHAALDFPNSFELSGLAGAGYIEFTSVGHEPGDPTYVGMRFERGEFIWKAGLV